MSTDAIAFVKMNGCGNDFIVVDNRRQTVAVDDWAGWVRGICHRRKAVGADGVILVEEAEAADFRWRFFNADGSLAEMCGNGARCVARFAHLQGIAGRRMTFETLAGPIRAEVNPDGVRIGMTDPSGLQADLGLALSVGTRRLSFIDTGVPHAVMFDPDPDGLDVVALGREIRHHNAFAPKGTNANFVALQDDGTLRLRTYERGVEDETLACGTGAVAAALVAAHKFELDSPVAVMPRGGAWLRIYFNRIGGDGFDAVELEGETRLVCRGELLPEAWQ